jgi:archaetidylinositol phosphate synthase
MIAQTDFQIQPDRRGETRRGGFVNAPRVHNALTAAAEKRLLIWMARRTPAAIGPDHLTALGFVGQLLAGGAYALARHEPAALWLVNVFLFLNWLGDSLDGTLARVRNQQRPRYGFYVDHVADTFGALALMAGLGAFISRTGFLDRPRFASC